ncbi:MAG: response regulator transcription factor [Alphaproteobacteria bacterium]|nr:response regulator transcription factor [Alphaproteobacteria bacterium]
MVERPHILVVDDDRRLRELLRKYLSDNDYAVSVAADAAEARQTLAGLSFDLIVLDVMMPGENGLDLTRSLRRVNPVPILLLTAMTEPEDRIRGLESGADDYLPKPFEPRELLLRIASILRRVQREPEPEAARLLRFGAFEYDVARGELRHGDQPVHLTSAESALLAVLAQAPDQILSREELASRTGASGNPRTVDVQITRLRKKMEDDSRLPRHVQTVRGRGYLLRPD